MATTKEYLDFITGQLAGLDGVRTRPMMGEYLLYYRDKLVGDICDNRLLVKPVAAAVALMPGARQEPPYPGAKPMLLVEELDDSAFLEKLLTAMEPELPAPKAKPKPKAKSK